MKCLYVALLSVRLLVALFGSSIVHPDEHSQHTDIAAGDAFGWSSIHRTWEWDAARLSASVWDGPVRSAAPIWSTSGVAFAIVRLVGLDPTPRVLVLSQRLSFFSLGLLHDFLLSKLLPACSPLLFASSPATLVFLSRPFGNTIEAFLLTLAWLLTLRLPTSRRPHLTAVALGLVGAIALWTRITSAAFLLPVGVLAASRLPIGGTLLAITSTLTACLLLIAFDTTYYGADRPVVTPLALLAYNLDPRNLALHGIHPRWLHLVVNGPLMFGPAWFLALLEVGAGTSRLSVDRALRATVVTGLGTLSRIRHQEPRFLLPLLGPVVVLASRRPRGRLFWTVHFAHALFATVLFGFIHQGGVLPSLLSSYPLSSSPHSQVRAISWKTFGLPRALLPPTSIVTDLAGSSPQALADAVCAHRDASVLFAPMWASPELVEGIELDPLACMEGCGVHADMDRLDEVWRAGWGRSGVGVWRAVCAA